MALRVNNDGVMNERIYQHLAFLYGGEKARSLAGELEEKLARFRIDHPELSASQTVERVSEKDTILITYGDMVREKRGSPLKSLADFLSATVGGTISTVHLLPFYPFSSDDGFSVIDYLQVDPQLGDWRDIEEIGRSFRLMFDAVVNHISAQSKWFIRFQQGDPHYQNYFTVVDGRANVEQVFRPRALPLLTEVRTAEGSKKVWTTFSADQVDLNYAEPRVLMEVIDTLLYYVACGAEFIRLDAVAYIWKEEGTSCIHLPQTHEIIRLMRTVLDVIAPRVAIITETNVPHKDNITYFGDGINEAQMVYNFSLPPLTLHSFLTGDARVLSDWARKLEPPSQQTTFLNFLASHDGIGLTPARGLLPEDELQKMVKHVEETGGYVSYRANPDGSQSAYELNINFLAALGSPDEQEEDPDLVAHRFIASQAIMLALRGVPGIYFHSLFGSRNWREGVAKTGRYRTINRQKLEVEALKKELADQDSLRYKVFSLYRQLLDIRRKQPAFHPKGEQMVLDIDPAVFALKRISPDGRSTLYCLQHVTSDRRLIKLPKINAALGNLLTGQVIESRQIELGPYEVMWLGQIGPGEA